MRSLFLTPGPLRWASTRFRAAWPAKYMTDAAWQPVDEPIPDDYDAYIYAKTIQGDRLHSQLIEGKQVWWDICDPVHWFNPREAREIADAVTGVVTSNQALTDDFNTWYGRQVAQTIPDRIDLDLYPMRKTHRDYEIIRLVWYGASQNRIGIFAALAQLERLIANDVKLELTLMDDHADTPWNVTDKFPIYQVPWQIEYENQIIAAHDIVLVPPYPGPWGRVKSNNKTLTAWACGLPASDCQNYDDLYDLATNAERRASDAAEGQSWLLRAYTADKSARDWERLLDGNVPGAG